MPVVQTQSALKSPPTNCYGLIQYLQQRVPGYDPSEYLRELNSAHIHVWEEISKLKNHYSEKIKTVTVVKAQFSYDPVNNADGALSAAVSPRYYQTTKIRVQPPAGGLFQETVALTPNHPDFIAVNANPSSTPTQTGPYYWYPSGDLTRINFALPLMAGTVLEFTYTFWPMGMVFLTNGTISSTGATVNGASTNFTNLLPPDFQAYLPNTGDPEEIQVELVCNPGVPLGGQIYRVANIASDTMLTTGTAISPALGANQQYVLATLPNVPREHIRVVASKALAAMYSVAGDDARFQEWEAKSEKNVQMMKDALIERQGQNPPQKIRFPYGISRRNRAFLR